MNQQLRYMFAGLAWTGLLISIISSALLNRGSLGAFDLLLIFITSVFAGAVIVDARTVLLASAGAIAFTSLFTYALLVLPLYLGRVGSPALGAFLSDVAVVIVIRSMIPVPVILILFGGLMGAFLAERSGLF